MRFRNPPNFLSSVVVFSNEIWNPPTTHNLFKFSGFLWYLANRPNFSISFSGFDEYLFGRNPIFCQAQWFWWVSIWKTNFLSTFKLVLISCFATLNPKPSWPSLVLLWMRIWRPKLLVKFSSYDEESSFGAQIMFWSCSAQFSHLKFSGHFQKNQIPRLLPTLSNTSLFQCRLSIMCEYKNWQIGSNNTSTYSTDKACL